MVCRALSNFLCLLRAMFSPLIQRNLSVCRCMAIFFIMFCGTFNTAFYSISFKVYSHTLGLYFFPLYGNSSCGSLGSGSDGVSIDLRAGQAVSSILFSLRFPFWLYWLRVMRRLERDCSLLIFCLCIYQMFVLLRAVV